MLKSEKLTQQEREYLAITPGEHVQDHTILGIRDFEMRSIQEFCGGNMKFTKHTELRQYLMEVIKLLTVKEGSRLALKVAHSYLTSSIDAYYGYSLKLL